MTEGDFSQLTNDVLFGAKHGLFEDDVGEALLRIYERDVCDDRIAGMIRRRVQQEKMRQAFRFVPFKSPKLPQGDLRLGTDTDGNVVSSVIQYLNAHSLTVANTGSGKTIKSRFLIMQIAPRVKGLWAVDLRKRDFRILRHYLKRLGIELIVVPGRSLKVNPLQVPEGVDPAGWSATISSILIQVLGLPPRASKLLQSTIQRLYRKFGILDGKELYPTLFDLFAAIKNNTAAHSQSRPAVLDSLEPVLNSLGPEVLAYRKGWSPQDMASMHLIFEFAGLADADINLLLTYITFSEFSSRIDRGVSNPNMDLWVCCDEANRLCSASHEANTRISDLVGLVRGSGIGLDFSVLSMKNLASRVPSNCSMKMMGRCGSAADYAAAGRSMGLTTEQIEWCKLNLRPGMFVCQLGQGGWRHPFVFTVPQMKWPNIHAAGYSDLGLRRLDSLPTVFAEEFRNWGGPVELPAEKNNTPKAEESRPGASAGGQQVHEEKDNSTHREPVLNEKELRFIKAVADSPMRPSSTYAKAARVSHKTARRLRGRLVTMGFLREHFVQASGRGRSSILLEVTTEGTEAINDCASQENQNAR